MNGIYQHYIIDLSSNNNFIQIPTMEGDGNNVRGFEVELIQNGAQYFIDKDDTIISIMGTKPDTKQIVNSCELTDDGYILVDITSQMSAVKGRGDYQIVLMSKSTNSQLKSFPFIILTNPASFDISHIVSSDEFQLLTSTLAKADTDYTYIIESAQTSANNAKSYADNANMYANNAKTSETNAKTSETNAKTSETNASNSATSASDSASTATEKASDASVSASDALASKNAAKTSETNAKTSETNASNSAASASASATSASSSATTATNKATEAANSATDASDSASTATIQANNASSSASSASQSASSASQYATTAQNYAIGSSDSAKYYYEQAKAISESFSGALRPMGTVAFANLPSLSSATEGDMYNVSDEFVTTSDFKEGAGLTEPVGSNIYKTSDGKWDILAGSPVTGIKGANETGFRRGNVNLTSEDIGAVSTIGDNSNTTTTFTQATTRANILTGEKLSVIMGKISKFFADLKTVAFTGSYADLSDKPSIPESPSDIGALATDGDSANNTVSFTTADSTTATAWTDVAVLTSGEKHSSIFNKISTMFKNIRYLYKMLGTTDISSIGDGTAKGAIYVLNNNISTVNNSLSNTKDVIMKGYETGKKVALFGDSLAEGYGWWINSSDKTAYNDGIMPYLRSIYPNSIWDNYGQSTATFLTNSGYPSITTKVLSTDLSKYDTICILGGINDLSYQIANPGTDIMGNICNDVFDDGYTASFDSTKIYSAIERTLQYVCTNRPEADKIFIITGTANSNDYGLFYAYYDNIIRLCNKWGFRVFNCDNHIPRYYANKTRGNYYTDMVHYNYKGYNKLSQAFADFLIDGSNENAIKNECLAVYSTTSLVDIAVSIQKFSTWYRSGSYTVLPIIGGIWYKLDYGIIGGTGIYDFYDTVNNIKRTIRLNGTGTENNITVIDNKGCFPAGFEQLSPNSLLDLPLYGEYVINNAAMPSIVGMPDELKTSGAGWCYCKCLTNGFNTSYRTFILQPFYTTAHTIYTAIYSAGTWYYKVV